MAESIRDPAFGFLLIFTMGILSCFWKSGICMLYEVRQNSKAVPAVLPITHCGLKRQCHAMCNGSWLYTSGEKKEALLSCLLKEFGIRAAAVVFGDENNASDGIRVSGCAVAGSNTLKS